MKFIEAHKDLWHQILGEDGPRPSPSPARHALLTLEQWHAVRDHWPADLEVGVIFPNDHDIETLVPDLPRLALVVLQFPKWVDGRAYSQAKLLRSRYRYAGEIRGVGEVVVDMAPLMARTGFSSAQMLPSQSIAAAERQLALFRGHYQGDARDNRPLFAMPAGTADTLARAPEFTNEGADI